MMRADLDAVFRAAGAAAWGCVAYDKLLPHMDEDARGKAEALIPHAAAVLVAAFPYFTGKTAGNLSVYARGADYHSVLRARLGTICNFINSVYPEYSFLAGADSSPLPEREAAWLAGIGLQGAHRLLILPPYGSYVFLGTILTDAPLPIDEVSPAPPCMGCGRCRSACPTGALECKGICLSELTQKKGALTAEEEDLLKAHPYLWGCDLCQSACPYNRDPKILPLPEFEADYLPDLTAEMVDGLTNREFKERFGHRAFAWRGAAVLRRNLELKSE